MNKFILTRKPRKYTQTDSTRPNIRIDDEAYQRLIKVAFETDQSIAYVAIKAIKFALDNLEYVDMD